MNKNLSDKGIEMLCNAIVIQAARDYQNTLCRCGGDPKRMSNNDKKMLSDCERFFNGNQIIMYTKLDGPTLMKRLYDEAKECNFDVNKLKELHKNENEDDEEIDY